MKNTRVLAVLGAFIGLIFLYSFSSNPLNGRTGPPCDINLCADCHTGGSNVDGNMMINGIPDTVNPGTSYEIEIKLVNPNFLGGRGGFQMTAINSSNTGAGSFTTSHPNTTVQLSGTKEYIEHNVAINFPGTGDNEIIYNGTWTAPDEPIGEIITFCAAGNLSNGNGNSAGDKIVQTSFDVSLEALTSSISDESISRINIYPNPFQDFINIDFSKIDSIDEIWLLDNFGKLVFHNRERKYLEFLQIQTNSFPAGIYFLHIKAENHISIEKLIKF